MEFIVMNQPKPDIRKFQILLLTIMLLITDVYKWSLHWSDNQKEIKLQQLETDRIKKALNYLYSHKCKGIQRLIDSAYVKNHADTP